MDEYTKAYLDSIEKLLISLVIVWILTIIIAAVIATSFIAWVIFSAAMLLIVVGVFFMTRRQFQNIYFS